MSTPLTAYQIRVLVEINDIGPERSCMSRDIAARIPGQSPRDIYDAVNGLIRLGLAQRLGWDSRLTHAGRRAAVLAYSDEVIR